MRFLYFTDTHIKQRNPKNRRDIFIDSMEKKFKEISELVHDRKIDYVLHGGDLFDIPNYAVPVAAKFYNLIKDFDVPFFMVAGNHDVFYNPESVSRTITGLMNKINIINLITEDDNIILEKDGLRVQLSGQPFYYKMDSDKRYYMLLEKEEECDYAIHMVHGMLVDNPFIHKHTLIDEIIETKADITLSGHYHAGFKTKEFDGKYFINPGALARLTNDISDIKRKPKVVIIDLSIDGIKIEEYVLKSALDGEDVIDRTKKSEQLYRNEIFEEFRSLINNSIDMKSMDINSLIIEISNDCSIGDEVREEALERIALAKEKMRQ